MSNLEQNLAWLKKAVQNLYKSYDKLLRAVPNPPTAMKVVETNYAEVKRILAKKIIKEKLQQVFSEYPNNRNNISEFINENIDDFTVMEAKSIQPIKIKTDDIHDWILDIVKDDNNFILSISNIDDLYIFIDNLHNQILIKIQDSRVLARKQKKKQKRQIYEGVCSCVAGIGLTATNAVSISVPLAQCSSFALGLNRLVAGYNKIVDSGDT